MIFSLVSGILFDFTWIHQVPVQSAVRFDHISKNRIVSGFDKPPRLLRGKAPAWWRLIAEKESCNRAFGCMSQGSQQVKINCESFAGTCKMPLVGLTRKNHQIWLF